VTLPAKAHLDAQAKAVGVTSWPDRATPLPGAGSGDGGSLAIGTIADDTLVGVPAIAEYLGKRDKETYYLLSTRQLPGFKIGNKWHLRRSTYCRFIENLEAEALAAIGR
jgi:hypothetical protein